MSLSLSLYDLRIILDMERHLKLIPRFTRSSKDAPTNPRGIPYAPFVDRVEDYVSTRADVEGTLKSFQEMIQ